MTEKVVLKWALVVSLVCGGLVATAYFMEVLPENGFSALLTWFNNFGVAITALSTIATAVIAIQALRSSAKDSIERTRPVVAAEFRIAEESDTSCDLVICNLGQSIARDVVVRFEGDLFTNLRPTGREKAASWIRERYSSPIGVLSPGHEFRNSWWVGVQPTPTSEAAMRGVLVNNNNLPDLIKIDISYLDSQGRRYSDSFSLNTKTILNSSSAFSSASMRGQVKKIAISLDKIAQRPPIEYQQDLGMRDATALEFPVDDVEPDSIA